MSRPDVAALGRRDRGDRGRYARDMERVPPVTSHGCDIVAISGLAERHRGRFYARCDCGWRSGVVRRKSTATEAAEQHLLKHDERPVSVFETVTGF